MQNLAESGDIESNMFAFSIGRGNETSSITIGGYEVEGNAVGPVVWHELANTAYWTVKFDRPMLGEIDIPTKTKFIIVDTGTSFNLLPPEDFDAVKGMIEVMSGI